MCYVFGHQDKVEPLAVVYLHGIRQSLWGANKFRLDKNRVLDALAVSFRGVVVAVAVWMV